MGFVKVNFLHLAELFALWHFAYLFFNLNMGDFQQLYIRLMSLLLNNLLHYLIMKSVYKLFYLIEIKLVKITRIQYSFLNFVIK